MGEVTHLQERCEQYVDKLIRHLIGVVVWLLEDLLDGGRLGERVKERLAALAEGALHALDEWHDDWAEDRRLLRRMQLTKVWVDDHDTVDALGSIDGGLQCGDAPDRIGDDRQPGAVRVEAMRVAEEQRRRSALVFER